MIACIGLTKAGKIEYRAEVDYLTSSATMLDDRNALEHEGSEIIKNETGLLKAKSVKTEPFGRRTRHAAHSGDGDAVDVIVTAA